MLVATAAVGVTTITVISRDLPVTIRAVVVAAVMSGVVLASGVPPASVRF